MPGERERERQASSQWREQDKVYVEDVQTVVMAAAAVPLLRDTHKCVIRSTSSSFPFTKKGLFFIALHPSLSISASLSGLPFPYLIRSFRCPIRSSWWRPSPVFLTLRISFWLNNILSSSTYVPRWGRGHTQRRTGKVKICSLTIAQHMNICPLSLSSSRDPGCYMYMYMYWLFPFTFLAILSFMQSSRSPKKISLSWDTRGELWRDLWLLRFPFLLLLLLSAPRLSRQLVKREIGAKKLTSCLHGQDIRAL